MKKRWIECVNCDYLAECRAGAKRVEGLARDSFIESDIGCFDHEVYIRQETPRQLGLFEH